MLGGILHCGYREIVVSTTAGEIRRTFVDAYPRYVVSILPQLQVAIDDVIGDAIVEGVSVLDGLLAVLESTPFIDQRSSPLELFREALRPIDRALALVGASTPSQRAGARMFAPWDRYGLSPGSSRVLGAEAHEALIAWGLTKAAAMASFVDATQGPAVGLFCPLSDVPGLVAEAEGLSYRTVALPSDEHVVAAVVCADEPDADAVIRSMTSTARIIVYGRAIDDIAQIRFSSLGASSVVPATRLLGSLGSYLPVVG